MCFLLLLIVLIIRINSINEESGKELLAHGYLTKAKQHAIENNDESLIKQVQQANSIYQLATSNKTSLQYSLTKYLELIDICYKSKKFHMIALNISLKLNNDKQFDLIYRKLRTFAPEDIEVLSMKGFKNLKNKQFTNAKVYFNEYRKQSQKYSQIIDDINLLEKSLKGSIHFVSKNQIEKSIKFLKVCQQIMQKYSISENSILANEIRKIDINIYISTQRYEEAIQKLNEIISKTNNNDEYLFIKRGLILYIHKDYSGCISDFEKAIDLTKDDYIKNRLNFYLYKAKSLHEKEKRISFYIILGLKPGAHINDVKISYRKLAARWHPDRFKDVLKKREAEKNMKLINRAFDVIGNEETKHLYDFCHHFTDVPPVFEDKRGFFSKLFNINKEDVWDKCYDENIQYSVILDDIPTNSTEDPTISDDLFKYSENSYEQFDDSDFE